MQHAFEYFGDESTRETQKFVSYFDKFFDCLNVRSVDEWARKKKPFLKPYRSSDDERLVVGNFFQLICELMYLVYCCSG